ncbi:CsgE family curli-type amyloid fiber assembly protein [Pseudomonadota bacterium]
MKVKYLSILIIFVSCYGFSEEDTKHLENGGPLETQESIDDLNEISGVVIDRTMTRLGANFYSIFSQKLNDKYDDLKENLTVKEKPTALSGSIITIYHRRKPIYRTALSPGRQQAEDKADEAVKIVGSYVVRWRLERYIQDRFDVDYDEI